MDQSVPTLGQAIGSGGGSGGDDVQAQLNQNAAPSQAAPVPGIAQPQPLPTLPAQQPAQPAQRPVSRLSAILGAVARTVDEGLAGIPSQGRPNFFSALGQGARSEQAAQTQQQEYRFRQFSDQVRAAQLHNESLRMQWADEDHQNAVQAQADSQAKRMTDTTGMQYTFVPNDDNGQAVLTDWGGQMAQDGHVSIPAGTIAGPKGWYIPNKGSAEQALANTQDYNSRAAFYGLPPVPQGKVVNDGAYDILRKISNGFDSAGNPIHANDIQARVDNMKEQLAKYKQTPNADFNTANAVQSDIDHLQNLQQITAKRESDALKQAQQQQLDTLNKSEAIKAKYAMEKQDNAAGDKPQKASVGSIVGFDPQTNERVVVNAGDPKASTLSQSSKVSGTQLDNWGTAQNQFANVQLAVSRYDQAARNFAQSGKPSDIVGINSALNGRELAISRLANGVYGCRDSPRWLKLRHA